MVAMPDWLFARRLTMSQLDRERLDRALSGDTAALREVIELMTPVVRARVIRALSRRFGFHNRHLESELADFTQEVFVALFNADAKALRAWDAERGLSFLNFVGLLAQHRVAEILRTRRWQIQAEELSLDDSHTRTMEPEAEAPSEDQLKELLEYLESKLSVRGLDMFERLYVKNQPIERVCSETGLSTEAVYQWRSRLAKTAREGLRTIETRREQASPPPRRAAGDRAGRRAR